MDDPRVRIIERKVRMLPWVIELWFPETDRLFTAGTGEGEGAETESLLVSTSQDGVGAVSLVLWHTRQEGRRHFSFLSAQVGI
jgi:hypothetical protein